MTLARSVARGVVFGACTLVLSSCHESMSPTSCAERTDLAVTVGAGDTPAIQWTPRCNIGEIELFKVDSAGNFIQEIWFVWAENNDVAPGVVFASRGEVNGTLTPGATYRVNLGVIVGGDASSTVGQVTFTR